MLGDEGEFVGSATRLADTDFERAAARLSCEVAAIRAVARVESGGGGGFLRDRRPKILFESRWFHKLTGGRFDATNPDLSTPTWVRNYKGGTAEYDRLRVAIALDRSAALKSTSWGMFQILGVNHAVAGFADVESYVRAQVLSEAAHLDAFTGYIITRRLDDELRDRRWADFAREYNGPGYAENRYDNKMADAYAEFARGTITPSTADVQHALNRHGADLEVDGRAGKDTRAAISAFQREAGLPMTGIADAATLAALGLSITHDPVAMSASLNA